MELMGSVGLVFFHFEVRNVLQNKIAVQGLEVYLQLWNCTKLGLPISLLRGSFTIAANRRSAKKPFRSTAKASRWGFQEKYIPRKMNECPLKRDHTVDGPEIRQSPVEVGSLDHYVQWFYTSQVVVWDFCTLREWIIWINYQFWGASPGSIFQGLRVVYQLILTSTHYQRQVTGWSLVGWFEIREGVMGGSVTSGLSHPTGPKKVGFSFSRPSPRSKSTWKWMVGSDDTPHKINIAPENDGLEDDFPLPGMYSQVPC